MGNEELEGTSEEKDRNDPERTGLAERERQDEEKAQVNKERQVRQGVVPDPNAEESESE